MPKMDGLEVLEQLESKGISLPTIVVTGDADIPSCRRAFKMGVLDFLEKPIDEDELLDCVQKVLARNVHSACLRRKAEELSATLSQLTERQKEVLDLLMAGRTLKEIAIHFQITVQALETPTEDFCGVRRRK